MTKQQLIKQIHDELKNGQKLPLYSYRTKNNYFPVIGEGSLDAKIVFIGEAPGLNEAKTGRPFIGAAGRVLDELLASIKLERNDVYITSILLDRPPENRDPLPKEIKAYTPFLVRQLEIIKPKVIATLGRFSMNFIFNHLELENQLQTIGKIHGQVFKVKASWGEVTVLPLYHPAAALYGSSIKPTLISDFKNLKKYI